MQVSNQYGDKVKIGYHKPKDIGNEVKAGHDAEPASDGKILFAMHIAVISDAVDADSNNSVPDPLPCLPFEQRQD